MKTISAQDKNRLKRVWKSLNSTRLGRLFLSFLIRQSYDLVGAGKEPWPRRELLLLRKIRYIRYIRYQFCLWRIEESLVDSIRRKLREESLLRKILPPIPITSR